MFQMLGVFAEFESSLIVERVRAGIARAQREGTRSGKAFGRRSAPSSRLMYELPWRPEPAFERRRGCAGPAMRRSPGSRPRCARVNASSRIGFRRDGASSRRSSRCSKLRHQLNASRTGALVELVRWPPDCRPVGSQASIVPS
jgi:DNA invertase Pin-like site-specific DNA recombinase